MEKKNAKRAQKPRQVEAKILVTTLSIAATLGAWQIFSRQEAHKASIPQADPPVVENLVESAPLPTLIPPLKEEIRAGSAVLPTPQQPNRILFGGAKPQPAKPAPVARTGSSR